jgi:hypothetical protein
VLQNDTFAAASGYPLLAINMDYELYGISGNLQVNLQALDQVFVYNYNGVSGNNFQVYYNQQAASFIMPQTNSVYQGFIGSPAAGLTNQQNWNTYGIAIAGAVAPSTATTMTGINGLVVALPSTNASPGAVVVPPTLSPTTTSAPQGPGSTSALVPNASSSTPAKSTAITQKSQSAPGGVVAGPLALVTARRNPVGQAAVSRRSPWIQ